ncbi:MAG: hypothetical protein GY701_02770 [Sulfitobacter sp.]|nr:hypothetical protein [Sulfitobacter sp.]
MPVVQYPAHGRNGGASGRSCLPAAAGAPVGVIAAEAAALFPATRPAYGHGGTDDLPACGRAGTARARPGAVPKARLGAVSFVHRFGSSLNGHLHFHCCVIDGVFEPQQGNEEAVQFREAVLTDADIQAVQVRVRQRVLRWFARQSYLDSEDAKDMAEWRNGGGFSVDASVRIEANDRAGLERLLRYCARPPFALERLEAIDAQRLMYHLPKPQPDGCTELLLTPLELIDRLVIQMMPILE